MKKTKKMREERILGRRLARELSSEDLEAATGGRLPVITHFVTPPAMSPDDVVD